MRCWKGFLGLVLGGALIALLAYGFTKDPRAIPTPLTGRLAPGFSLRLFDGQVVRLSDYRGKVVFLNFWASWCPPCREEAPLLERLWHRYKAQDVVFLGVDIQDSEEAARSFLRDFAISYLNGRDPDGRIAIDYGVYGIPETFFIDREGRITYKHIGALEAGILGAKIAEAQRGQASAEGKSGGHGSITVR